MQDTMVCAKEPVQHVLDDCSLEITGKDLASLTAASGHFKPGTSISVTFLPGEDPDLRVAAALGTKQLGFTPFPHISARRIGSEAELRVFLARLSAEVGIDRAFVVAGDPDKPLGPYEDALAIIRSGILSEYGVRKVGIGGYPEGHSVIPDDKLWQALRDKHAAIKANGQSCEIITQFGFDADPVLDWLEKIRGEGIDSVVRIGLPGPASVKTLLRFASRCGVAASTTVLRKYGLSVTKLLSTAGPDNLLKELSERLDPAVHGETRIHLYPFGGLERTGEWIRTVKAERN